MNAANRFLSRAVPILFLAAVPLNACQSEPVASDAQALTASNPVPTTTSLSPTSAIASSGNLGLTVHGTSFLSSSTVQFKGATRTTTYVSANEVTASLLASDVATAGAFPVTVTNPGPGGGISNEQTFTVVSMYPLTVTKAGTGTGTVASTDGLIDCGTVCSGTYAEGTQVQLTATAAPGSPFAGWSGYAGCSGTDTTCTVMMSSAVNVTATFSKGSVWLGASGLTDTTFTPTFIEEMVQSYGVWAIRIPGTESTQFAKYTDAGVKMIYAQYGPSDPSEDPSGYASDIVAFLQANPTVTYVSASPNEPNIPPGSLTWTAANYVPFLKAAYTAIKASQLPVVVSAFEVSNAKNYAGGGGYTFVQDALAEGAGGYFDVVGVHQYPGPDINNLPAYSTILDDFHDLVARPLVISETNIAGAGGNGGTYYGTNESSDSAHLFALFEGKDYVQGILWFNAANPPGFIWNFPLFDSSNDFAPVMAPYFQEAFQQYGQP
jgi:hypothetical protein